mgnify:FL=1
MTITIQLTEQESDHLFWALQHLIQDIDEMLPDIGDDHELREEFAKFYDISQRVSELIQAETTEQIINGEAS